MNRNLLVVFCALPASPVRAAAALTNIRQTSGNPNQRNTTVAPGKALLIRNLSKHT